MSVWMAFANYCYIWKLWFYPEVFPRNQDFEMYFYVEDLNVTLELHESRL